MQIYLAKNIKNLFIYSLFFILPLIHSKILNIDIYWNFEFTKSVFFIVFSSFIILLNIKSEKKKINIFSLFFIVILLISSIFSLSPFHSFFWSIEKWHSFFLFLNLIILYNIFVSLDIKSKQNILNFILISSIFPALWGIKEFFSPSFYYDSYIGRAIGSFWSPHYLASYILLLSPFFFDKILKEKKYYYTFIFIPLIFCLFLTKSFIAIFAFLFYIFFLFFYEKNKKVFGFWMIFLIILFIFSIIFFPSKIHSLLSRFFIWESVIKIIFSSPKIFFLWWWNETLNFIFWNFKSPFLYIFENFWYQADRSHNVFLDFFYNFWIWGFLLISLVFWFLIKHFERNPYFESLLLFFFFYFFNFSSIVSYLLFIFFMSFISLEKWWFKKICKKLTIRKSIWIFWWRTFIKESRKKKTKYIFSFVSKIFIIFYSIFSIFIVSRFFISEYFFLQNQYKKAIFFFPHPNYFYEINLFNKGKEIEKIKSPLYFKKKILNLRNIEENCKEYLTFYTSAEDYFFCWNMLEKRWYKKEAIIYYEKWLKKIPNLWEKNSPYFNNFLIKNTINGNRFFSEKYSNIKDILEKF